MNDGIVLAREAVDLMLGWLETSGAKNSTASSLGRCPVCGNSARVRRYTSSKNAAGECGVRAESFRPATFDFGQSPGLVAACARCGHGSLANTVDASQVSTAYAEAEDPVTLHEREGRLDTARRTLSRIERHRAPGAVSESPGTLLDVGCWTGEFLLAAPRLADVRGGTLELGGRRRAE